MSLWSWVRALTEAKEKGMGHAPIACEWDHPSSEWARGWGPYNYEVFTPLCNVSILIYEEEQNHKRRIKLHAFLLVAFKDKDIEKEMGDL